MVRVWWALPDGVVVVVDPKVPYSLSVFNFEFLCALRI